MLRCSDNLYMLLSGRPQVVMIFRHSNDDMKFYMRKYDKRIFDVFYV